MIKKTVKFFDKLEDHIRGRLSHIPVLYGIIGAVFVVLFWRGVWHTADMFENWGGAWGVLFSAPVTAIVSAVALLLSGLFVASFIGSHIIISGLKKEKKLIDKTESEISSEGSELAEVRQELKSESDELIQVKNSLQDIKRVLDEIKNKA